MHLAQRLEARDTQNRRSRELVIWWMRLAAVVFTTFQTVLSPGDIAWVSWVVAAAFWVTVLAGGAALRRPLTERGLRWVGLGSMVADVAVVVSVLGNNLTDPAEPIYLVSILAVLEATMRWPTLGGAISGVAAGVAAATWTLVVYDRIGVPAEVDFATMRGGVFIVIGAAFGALTRRLAHQHRDLQRVLDTSRDLIIAVQASTGVIVAANFACERVLGRAASDLVGRSWREFLDPSQPAEILEGPLEAEDGTDLGSSLALRRFLHADGHPVWLELSISVDVASDRTHATGRDVTERLAVERQVQISEQRFRSLFDHNPDPVYSFDLTGRFTSANRATEELVGFTLDELRELSFHGMIAPEDRGATAAAFARVVEGEPQTVDLAILTRHGNRADLEVTAMPIVVDGAVVGVFGMSKDVTERRRLERELGHQATHDALTGLQNRGHLESVLAHSMDGPATLLFVDLDRFKVVNDSLGHRSGDELLVLAAGRLGRCLRSDDVLVRWAGDEFCVLLAGETSEPESLAIADRLLRAVAEPFRIEGRDVRVSASVGVARARPGDTPERLVQMADTAMYEAKREGRNRLSIFDPHRSGDAANPIDYENQLRHAVHDDLLAIEYQPIVEMATGRIVAVESLLRWHLPDGSSHPPDEFIAVAEACGLIRDITRWVLWRACAQLAEWDRATGCSSTVQVWVNVSALDLQDPDLVAEVVAALDAASLAPERLVLEVTESSLLSDVEEVEITLGGLRRLGVALAIDDFGTGYSSMARLHRLRVAACKIDRAFVSNAPSNEQDAAIVQSLTELGGVFGFGVVGEGVETVDQARALQLAGCSLAQGFLFARPAPPDQLVARLAAGRIDLPPGTGGLRAAEGALPSAG